MAKNTLIAIEPIHNPGGNIGYLKVYKEGNSWKWKATGSKVEATKFDAKTADWRSKKHQKNDSYGAVIFYPIEL